jgi:hypothetical protein
LEGLSQLVKTGELGRLEVVNITIHPDTAQQLGVRSVPWCRIGPFELEGAQSPTELTKWTQHATAGTGLDGYYTHLLETQRPHKVAATVEQNPSSLSALLNLLEDPQTPMSARIGIGVVLEGLHGNPILRHALPVLRKLATSSEANIRADTAHYLGLTDANEALVTLRQLLHDDHPDVREIAAESIETLTHKP